MVVNMITRELSPDIVAIGFTGRLVLGNQLADAEHAIRERIRQGSRKLLFDLSELEHIDSAGIGMLAVCFGRMEQEGGKVAVAGATGRVKELLELTRLNHLAEIHADVASAQSALAEFRPASHS